MLWLTLRQYRTHLLATGGILLALAAVLLIHGLLTQSFIAQSAPVGCPSTAARCTAFDQQLMGRYQQLQPLLQFLALAPALIGAFWGAPLLAREYERGTYKLVWTQTVSRQKWLAVKLSVIGAAAALGGLALGAMISAWLSVFRGTAFPGVYPDRSIFDLRGIVPAGWWLFSFMLGGAAGAVIRRTLPAMAVTMALAIVLLMSFNYARDYVYAAPDQLVVTTLPVSAALPAGSSYVDSWWLDAHGNVQSEVAVQRATAATCPQTDPHVLPDSCLMSRGYRAVVLFQPPTRWWRYQLTEDTILVLASLLTGALIIVAGRSRTRSHRPATSATGLTVATEHEQLLEHAYHQAHHSRG